MTFPKFETIAIGDELLTGKIADTNSAFVADELFRKGYRLERVTVIEDTIEALHTAMDEAKDRADFVICFGGLGPTSDDKTAEAVSRLLGSELITDKACALRVKSLYEARGREINEAAMKQALYPAGTEPLANSQGLAPGFAVRYSKATFFFLPGVPQEMKFMFRNEVVPRLKLRGEEIRHHQWKCLGVWESHLQETLTPVESRLPKDAWIGYRTKFPENHVTLYYRGKDSATFDKLVSEITTCLAQWTYTRSGKELEELILDRLKERGETLALAESCTGGLVGQRLSMIAGASEALWGSYTVYQIDAKAKMLGVRLKDELDAVSARCTRELAESAKLSSGCAVSAAVTGYLGPTGGTDMNPIGTIYVAVVGRKTIEKKIQLSLRDRAQAQWGAATYLLAEIHEALK